MKASWFINLVVVLALFGFYTCSVNRQVPVGGIAPLSLSFHEHTEELIRQSPIIVVGSILTFRPVGRITKTKDERLYPVQLKRISLGVENVLRGEVRSPEIDIYFYQWAGDYVIKGKNIDQDRFDPGGRRVYFLTFEGGRYRCFQDIYRSYIQVLSGRHRNLTIGRSKPMQQVIAEILLTPGEDMNAKGFANGYLSLSIGFARGTIGEMRTLALVKPILSHPDPLVRDRACVEMSVYFQGQDSCLDDLLKRQDLPAPVRAQATRYLELRKQRDDVIKYWFSKDLIQWLKSHTASEDPVRILDSLQLLTLHRDPEIRKMACAFMAQKFPNSYERSCGNKSDP